MAEWPHIRAELAVQIGWYKEPKGAARTAGGDIQGIVDCMEGLLATIRLLIDRAQNGERRRFRGRAFVTALWIIRTQRRLQREMDQAFQIVRRHPGDKVP